MEQHSNTMMETSVYIFTDISSMSENTATIIQVYHQNQTERMSRYIRQLQERSEKPPAAFFRHEESFRLTLQRPGGDLIPVVGLIGGIIEKQMVPAHRASTD